MKVESNGKYMKKAKNDEAKDGEAAHESDKEDDKSDAGDIDAIAASDDAVHAVETAEAVEALVKTEQVDVGAMPDEANVSGKVEVAVSDTATAAQTDAPATTDVPATIDAPATTDAPTPADAPHMCDVLKQVAALSDELASLRSRLDACEAQPLSGAIVANSAVSPVVLEPRDRVSRHALHGQRLI